MHFKIFLCFNTRLLHARACARKERACVNFVGGSISSVTRRSGSDVCDSLTDLLTVSTDFTDVTLVSDDTYL